MSLKSNTQLFKVLKDRRTEVQKKTAKLNNKLTAQSQKGVDNPVCFKFGI